LIGYLRLAAVGVEALAAVYTIRFLLPGPKTWGGGGEGMTSGDGGVAMADDGSDVLRDAVEGTSLGNGDKEGTVCGEVGGGGDTT
jgi:hypothetical protein